MDAGPPLWQRILSILKEKRREEFLAKLTLNLLLNFGAEVSIENRIKIPPSAVHANLKKPGLLELLRETPLALHIKTLSEVEWASELADEGLNVTELYTTGNNTTKYLPGTLDTFPRSRTVWLEEDAVMPGKVSESVTFKRYDRWNQSRILSTVHPGHPINTCIVLRFQRRMPNAQKMARNLN